MTNRYPSFPVLTTKALQPSYTCLGAIWALMYTVPEPLVMQILEITKVTFHYYWSAAINTIFSYFYIFNFLVCTCLQMIF